MALCMICEGTPPFDLGRLSSSATRGLGLKQAQNHNLPRSRHTMFDLGRGHFVDLAV